MLNLEYTILKKHVYIYDSFLYKIITIYIYTYIIMILYRNAYIIARAKVLVSPPTDRSVSSM